MDERATLTGLVASNRATLAHVMDACVDGETEGLSFEESYRSAYNLQLLGHGAWVLDAAARALRRINLRPYDDARYLELSRIVVDVTYFPNATVALRRGLETTEQAAVRLRGARGLGLWRLLVTRWVAGLARVEIWKERIRRWRVAFDAVAFRPDQPSAEATRRHFLALAAGSECVGTVSKGGGGGKGLGCE